MDLSRDRLETRELVYFLTVAEELHFGRAAERLGIAQPPLSRAIARLERRVGVPLFARTSRSVALTAAGQALLAGARATLEALDLAVRRTQAAGASGLRLAAAPGAGTVPLRALITAYGSTRDAAAIEMVFHPRPGSRRASGQADLALACDTEDLSGLETLDIATERPIALLPVQHPLAAGRSLSLRRLRAEATFAEQGPALSLDEIIDSVALDRLIVIVGEGAAARTGPAVPACRSPGSPSTLVLAWQAMSSPATGAFLAAARRYVTRTGPHALASVAASYDRPATAADRYRAQHQPHGNRAAIGRGDGDHAHRRPVAAVSSPLTGDDQGRLIQLCPPVTERKREVLSSPRPSSPGV